MALTRWAHKVPFFYGSSILFQEAKKLTEDGETGGGKKNF